MDDDLYESNNTAGNLSIFWFTSKANDLEIGWLLSKLVCFAWYFMRKIKRNEWKKQQTVSNFGSFPLENHGDWFYPLATSLHEINQKICKFL